MKKAYIKPMSQPITKRPVTILAGSNFDQEDFGGGGGDGGGAVVNSLDADFGEEDFEEIVYN
jgi:hypothetical protein